MFKYSKIVLSVAFLLLSTLLLSAKDLSKYLAPVSEVDGKVVFTKRFDLDSNKEASSIYDMMIKWAFEQQKDSTDKYSLSILLEDPTAHKFVCQVKQNEVLRRVGITVDDVDISYYLLFEAEEGACVATIRNIRYDYFEDKGVLTAEEMISDKEALSQDKTRMFVKHDKFRIATIDMVDKVFSQIQDHLKAASK